MHVEMGHLITSIPTPGPSLPISVQVVVIVRGVDRAWEPPERSSEDWEPSIYQRIDTLTLRAAESPLPLARDSELAFKSILDSL
jgi:hypothetical protein